MKKTNLYLVGILLCLTLSSVGWAGPVFQPYPSIMQPLLGDIANKQPQKAFEQISKKVDGVDKILYLQERGRISTLIGNYDVSTKDFNQVKELYESNSMRPIISVSDTATNVASIVTNDNIIPYAGEFYEWVFVHTYQMLNYLNNQDIQGAMVEMRNAANLQKRAEEQHEKEMIQAEDNAKKNGISRAEIEKQFDKPYAEMELAASKVKNSFQNASTYYISGVLREMANDNDAYIDYKKAWEICPENKYIIQSLYRLANDQKRNDLPMLRDKYGRMNIPSSIDTAKKGRLVVLYEDGFVPPKDQIKLPLLIAGKIYTIAMPYYKSEWKDPVQINIYDGNNVIGQTESICLVRSLAVKALKEKYLSICIRQALRLVAKDQIQRAAQAKGGILGKLAVGTVDAAITNADVRSWLTLPDNLQVADFWFPSGSYSIAFGVNPTPGNRVDVNIKSGQTHFLHVINTGRGWYTTMINPYDTVRQPIVTKSSASK
jgi:hypothetical protein